MLQAKRQEVSELLKLKTTTIKSIAKRYGVSLKTVYYVKATVSDSKNLKHRKGAGRPMIMSKNNKISLAAKFRKNPRVSVRRIASEFQTADTLYPDGWKLQEDNSSIHTSKFSCAFKETYRVRRIDWPPNSPDLNPIENLWGVLKHRIIVNAPKTIEEVESMIHSQWETFEPDFLSKFTSSMKKRCNLVIASGGKKITISNIII
ncbi:hypothetical protein LOD99_1554 [Oopsacas minuta]|uniref:Tc1-like transposase DDE domain-containing protein n=1 Tax=Oopsacas minuta TaxID=111878 RepID=A0AAV7K5L8_9METZ|nr:hypothetical protein LOD99_1554 [Oopsacas minuta]